MLCTCTTQGGSSARHLEGGSNDVANASPTRYWRRAPPVASNCTGKAFAQPATVHCSINPVLFGSKPFAVMRSTDRAGSRSTPSGVDPYPSRVLACMKTSGPSIESAGEPAVAVGTVDVVVVVAVDVGVVVVGVADGVDSLWPPRMPTPVKTTAPTTATTSNPPPPSPTKSIASRRRVEMPSAAIRTAPTMITKPASATITAAWSRRVDGSA